MGRDNKNKRNKSDSHTRRSGRLRNAKNVSFTAGSVTLTVEFADAAITEGQTAISVSDLAVGKLLCVRFGEDGKPSSAEVVTIGTSKTSGGQGPGNGGGMNGGGVHPHRRLQYRST